MANKHTVKLVKVHWDRVGNRAFEPNHAEIVFCTQASAANNLRRSKGKPNPLWMDIDSAKRRGIQIDVQEETAHEAEEVVEEVAEETIEEDVQETVQETTEETKPTTKRARRPKAKKYQK